MASDHTKAEATFGHASAPCRTYNAVALLRLSAYGIATKGKPLLGTTGSLID